MTFWNNSEILKRLVFWATLIAVAVPFIFGLLALMFQKRAKHLEDLQNRALTHDLQLSKREVGELQRRTEELNEEIEAGRRAKVEAEKQRRTPPQITVDLVAQSSKKFRLEIRLGNSIPFEFKSLVTTTKDLMVTGIPLEWTKVFPNQKLFYANIEVNWALVKEDYLEVRFDFRSLAADLIETTPGHQGKIIKKYRVSRDGNLIPLD